MTTFNLPNTSPPCPVDLQNNLTKDQLLAFPAFKTWLSTLQHSLSLQSNPNHPFHTAPYILRKIVVQSCDFFTPTHLGFLKLHATVTNDANEWLPGAVFLRGGSVAMLLILQPDDIPEGSEEDKHVLLTIQPRIAAGSLAMAELPAGMLDGGTFAGKAAAEIQEETGLEVPENELVNMSDLALSASSATEKDPPSAKEKLQNAMYPSPGACDEFIPIFLYQKRIPRSQLDEWRGKLTGLRDEGEKITIRVVRLEEVWKEAGRDAKALAAMALYHGLRAEGKV